MPAMPPLDPPAGRGAPPPSGRLPNPQFSWRDFWALTRPYWVSKDRWRGGALLAVVVGLSLGLVYLNVQFNLWYNVFYTALQKFDQPAFFHQLMRFCFLAALYIAAAVYRVYLNQALQIRWRKWLTEYYLDRWLDGRAYYRLQLGDHATDNPDQRIAEDLRQFVQLTLSLSLGLLSSVVTLVSFCAILWTLSGALSFTLWGHAVVIPGYMLWAALLYAILGTWLTDRIGRPLVGLNFEQQRFEANFRYSLVRLRENAEAVALYGGEARERDGFLIRFNHVVGNWWALIRRQKRLTWFTTGYSQAAVIFPFVVAAPRYFSKGIELGGLMQTASAFGQVQDALSYLVTAYTDIAEWRAVIERLSGFRRAVALPEGTPSTTIVIRPGDRPALGIEALDLRLPDGSLLLAATGIELEPGCSVLITGASGSGKSTLFRALSGIWPFGSGQVRLPAGARLMFLPQKPYMPLGSLAEALSYPDDPALTDVTAKQHALIDCGLAALVSRLDEQQNWGQVLSPGEQQRLAFARVLLKQPDWLFLDEATAALDEAMEQRLYRMLRQRLPGLNLVSVGHRSGLVALHDRVLVVQSDGHGGRLVEPDAMSAAGE